MTDIRYSYAGVPTIKRFSESDAFMRGLMGPFGSGKSSGCVIEIVRRAHQQSPGPDGVRRSRWAVIRNTYQQLRDTTIKTFHEWLPPELFGNHLTTHKEYSVTGFPGVHIEVMFRALDRPDDIKNLLSLELTGAWVNEAREVPWSIIEALQGRVGRYPSRRAGGASWHGIIMDTNPPDDLSGWYRYFEEIRPHNAAVFKQPSGMSPDAENVGNLPNGYYENLAEGKDDEFVKVYVRGEYGFVMDGKPMYPEFLDSAHVGDCGPVAGKPIRRGWDFGLTPACTFSQMLPSGRWAVFDELVSDNMGADRFSDEVLKMSGDRYAGFEFEDIGDPAGEQRAQSDATTCFQVLQGKGINIRGGEQDMSARLESVKHPLNRMVDGKPMFILHPRCKMLRRGFQGGYHRRRIQTGTERYADKPEKNAYSHPHDALQYDATELFSGVVKGHKGRSFPPIQYPQRRVI